MDTPDVTRTTASRRSPGWIRGALAIFGSGIAAVVVGTMPFDGPAGQPWMAVVGPVVVLVAGGVLAGNQADPPLDRKRIIRYLWMPIPTVLIAAFYAVIDFSAEGFALLALLFGLWEAPLFVTLLVRSKKEQRVREELQRLRVPFGPPPLEGELAAATRNSRSATVIRQYIDDKMGEEQLEADKVALEPHGYELVSVEEKRRPEPVRALGQLFTVLFVHTVPDAESNNDRIVATFQRRRK